MPDAPKPVHTWEHDPASGDAPDGGALVTTAAPDLSKGPFAIKIVTPGPPPSPEPHKPGTAAFRHWVAAASLHRMQSFWAQLVPTGGWHPDVGDVLPVFLDEGVDLNAFYDRQSLQFFHAVVKGHAVFSGESPDILCHEAGHAALDALRPQLWDVASLEVGAFHESFGDIISLLSGLQVESLRVAVLEETDGRLFRSSRLSRLAEQLGWAIRQRDRGAVESDCLRNAVNSFFYRPPSQLPTTAPATELSSEPHSFSRVFTAAFFRALAGMLATRPAATADELLVVTNDMARFLVGAVRSAPVVADYFSQVAAHLLKAARAHDDRYAAAISGAMVRHGILSPGGVVTVARSAMPHAMAAVAAAPPPRQTIDVSQYGFTVPAIVCQTASQPKAFAISPPSTSHGEEKTASAEDTARDFVEDLLRRSRLDPKGFAPPGVSMVDPDVLKTHELVQEGPDVVLKRRRMECLPRKTG